jgi:hypothetical protein
MLIPLQKGEGFNRRQNILYRFESYHKALTFLEAKEIEEA